jgi:hypothetical protein
MDSNFKIIDASVLDTTFHRWVFFLLECESDAKFIPPKTASVQLNR